MVKRIFAFVTALMLSLSVSMPSFASVATPSDAVPMMLSLDDGISLADASSYGSVVLYAQGDYGTVSQEVYYGQSFTIPSGTTNYWYNFNVTNWVGNYVTLNLAVPVGVENINVIARFADGTNSGWHSLPAYLYRRTGISGNTLSIPVSNTEKESTVFTVSVHSSGFNGNSITGWMDDDVYKTITFDGLYSGDSSSNPSFSYAQVNNIQAPWNTLTFSRSKNSSTHLWTYYRLLDPTASTSSAGSVYLYRGYEYYMYFQVNGFDPFRFYIKYNGVDYISGQDFSFEKLSDSYYKVTFTPPTNMLVANVQFGMDSDDSEGFGYFSFYPMEIETSYIPKTDTDGQSQQTAANTTVIKNVVTNIENVVNNISNQITNMVTNITSAISNGVSQITQNDNQNTDKIVSNDDENTDKVIQADKENTDKILASDEKLHIAQLENDDKNADAIMNSYDNSSLTAENDKLSDTLTEFESVENELFDQASENLNNFQFEDPFDKFSGPLSDISYFLNGIYYGLGAFNIPIGFSLTLAIALLCIGWYRFRGG